MKSCLARRESRAAPFSGGLHAIDAVFRFVILYLTIAIACFATPGVAQAAGAVGGGPMIPALQSLINSATVSTAAPASGASAADAASAPSPASQAELEKSLDSVITTLDSDRQRTALVTQLKKLRDATKTVGPPVSASAPSSAGLLGAIAAGIASFETDVQQ